MNMPQEHVAWPPARPGSEQVREWAAWYSGNPGDLEAFYTSRAGKPQVHTSQLRGGVVGKLARWWWGTPQAAGERDAKLHVPLAADICGTSADLLFSEPVRFGTGDGKADEFLQRLQEDGLDARLQEGAEVSAALGGGFLRTVWDSTVSPRPWTEVVHPDGAVPEWRQGRLAAVNLWSELAEHKAGTVHRLVERHERGAIRYGLYAGTSTNLGKLVPVTAHPEAAYLAEVPGVAPEGATLVQPTGLQRLAVVYVPNMLPNRLHRHSLEGRSDLQGVEPLLDALDEAYSSWWRDIRHAKSRIHVPAQYLEDQGAGKAAAFNVDRELYVPVEGVLGTAKEGLLIQAQQFAIRVAEHAETCKAWTERIIESAGYSTQSLSSGTGGAVTAAEVHSHERRSYMTRGKKIRYWSAALREHAMVQLEVGAVHLRSGVTVPDRVRVEFEDGVQESAMSLAQTALALRNAEAASVQTRVELVHPDWSPEDVDDETRRILDETGGGEPLGLPGDAGF